MISFKIKSNSTDSIDSNKVMKWENKYKLHESHFHFVAKFFRIHGKNEVTLGTMKKNVDFRCEIF